MSMWKPKYSVQIKQLDDQHNEFFKILEEFSVASKNKDVLDIDYTIIKLEVYAMYHFTCEEHYMAKFGYPDFENHKREHDEYRKEVKSLKDNLDVDKISVTDRALKFLEEWWVNHILKIDKQYGPFLSERLKYIPY